MVEEGDRQPTIGDDGLHDSMDDDLFAAARANVRQKRSSVSPAVAARSSIEHQIEQYLSDVKNLLPSKQHSSDAINYWIDKSSHWPGLFNVAIDVLSVPATSAPVERVFSRASYILAGKRHNLTDDRLESELFFKANYINFF